MNKDLVYIKKKYGEKMAQLCRDLFPTILETEGLLTHILTNNFNPSHDLYDDLVSNKSIEDFKKYIYKKFNLKKDGIVKTNKTPEELMDEAGYILYKCETEEDIQSFRKYYAPDEELCTFWCGRLNTNYVFFAVKKNVDEIKREDFPNPERQDEYGTSVISIQFSRNEAYHLSIKNRYNHTVNNCDATFSNDLDNIIPGLTYSFEKYYGMKQKNPQGGFEMPGYRKANDGRFYKYNYEINNINYCPDNIIIDNGEVKRYDKSEYLILDYFIIDLANKKITFYDERLKDSFPETIGTINKIEVINQNDFKEIRIISEEYGEVIIKTDKFNRIISYINNEVKEAGDNLLSYGQSLEIFSANSLRKLGNNGLSHARNLKEFHAENLEEARDNFLINAISLEIFRANNLRKLGNNGLSSAKKLKEFHANNLEEAGDRLLTSAESLEIFSANNLRKLGYNGLSYASNLKEFYAENLEETGDHLLFDALSLEIFSANNLRKLGNNGLRSAKKLKEFHANNLEEAEDNLLTSAESLEIFSANNLRKLGNNGLRFAENLKEFHANNLEEAGYNLLTSAESLEIFSANNLRKLENNGLSYARNLKEFYAENLEEAGEDLLTSAQSLVVFIANNLKRIGNDGLSSAENLKEFHANNLEEAGDRLLTSAQSLEVFHAPNLSNIPEHLLAKAKNLKEFNVSSGTPKR